MVPCRPSYRYMFLHALLYRKQGPFVKRGIHQFFLFFLIESLSKSDKMTITGTTHNQGFLLFFFFCMMIVLLLGARVAASAAQISAAEEKKAWLILAWVSTVAGNLSLLGSAANLIVCEQARRAQHLGYTLSFWRHLKFGVPATLVVTAIGLTLIRG